MSQIATKKSPLRLRFLPIGIIVLTVFTALIHLMLALGTFWVRFNGPPPAGSSPEGLLIIATLFLLNGIGYLVLVIALFIPRLQRFQHLTCWLLIGFTALTIVLWYFIEASHADLFDYSDKLIEVVLIALLLIKNWQIRRRTA